MSTFLDTETIIVISSIILDDSMWFSTVYTVYREMFEVDFREYMNSGDFTKKILANR